jgi:hypothetical protein
MKFLSKSFYHLRRELGIQGVHLAGFSWGQVDDQKGDHRDKEQGDDLLYDTPANK